MAVLSKLKRFLHEYKLYTIKNGAYKFLLQKLDSHPSIEVASAIIGSGYFRRNLVPLAINTDELKKIIVFAPHQDDEAIGCGGLLSKLSILQHEIHIVFLTDGNDTHEKMKKIRCVESQKVADILGAQIYNINISNINFNVKVNDLNNIAKLLDNIKPDAIFTTWPLDAPPKHRLCNVILNKALSKSKYCTNDLQVYNYQVHTGLIPNMYFEYTSLFEKKQNLIRIYKSQIETQNYMHLSAGLDAWNSKLLPWSKKERYVELYTVLPKEAFSELVQMYTRNVDETFNSNKLLINAYQNINSL